MDKSIIKKLAFIQRRLETLANELDSQDIEVTVDVWAMVFMLYDLDEVRYEILRQGGSIT